MELVIVSEVNLAVSAPCATMELEHKGTCLKKLLQVKNLTETVLEVSQRQLEERKKKAKRKKKS